MRDERPTQSVAPFLRAEWRDLVMLNFRAAPELLAPLVPPGLELDYHQGNTYVSIVGFRFLRTHVLGLRILGHQRFEEVNLRFYVRRETTEGMRRGVVFVKEIAPRAMVALVANLIYHENYLVRPMRTELEVLSKPSVEKNYLGKLAYTWRHNKRWSRIGGDWTEPPTKPVVGTRGNFIVEHYWGYGRDGKGRTLEYQVCHPPWKTSPLKNVVWDCDISATYGANWVETLQRPPESAAYVEGSEISVMRATRLESSSKPSVPLRAAP